MSCSGGQALYVNAVLVDGSPYQTVVLALLRDDFLPDGLHACAHGLLLRNQTIVIRCEFAWLSKIT